ncbi:MAG: hypothetical protein IJ214_08135 [Clostridia bacterium]|nr:hypothetical protein [Clostridia bacterium]
MEDTEVKKRPGAAGKNTAGQAKKRVIGSGAMHDPNTPCEMFVYEKNRQQNDRQKATLLRYSCVRL